MAIVVLTILYCTLFIMHIILLPCFSKWSWDTRQEGPVCIILVDSNKFWEEVNIGILHKGLLRGTYNELRPHTNYKQTMQTIGLTQTTVFEKQPAEMKRLVMPHYPNYNHSVFSLQCVYIMLTIHGHFLTQKELACQIWLYSEQTEKPQPWHETSDMFIKKWSRNHQASQI